VVFLECGGSTPLSFCFGQRKKKESGVEPPHSKKPAPAPRVLQWKKIPVTAKGFKGKKGSHVQVFRGAKQWWMHTLTGRIEPSISTMVEGVARNPRRLRFHRQPITRVLNPFPVTK